MKFTAALATLMVAAYAQGVVYPDNIEDQVVYPDDQAAEENWDQPEENWDFLGGRGGYAVQQRSYGGYGGSAYGGQRGYGGYGARAAPVARGYQYSRRSSIRPRDIKAYNAAPVDSYYQRIPKQAETIKASCEFDFLGYSDSTGRIALEQQAGDLTSMIGEFWGLKPGLKALKIHEFGDLEYGCDSTGDVYNPFGAKQGHAHFDIYDRRVGDIEQLSARWDTEAEYKNRDLLVSLSGPNSVLGRAMVLYEREDDHDQVEHPATTKKDLRVREGMGERIACCVIGLAKGDPKVKAKPVPKPDTKLKEEPKVEEPKKEAPILKSKAPIHIREAPKAVRKGGYGLGAPQYARGYGQQQSYARQGGYGGRGYGQGQQYGYSKSYGQQQSYGGGRVSFPAGLNQGW